MTRKEFLSAAAKGQGRAIAALRSGDYVASFHDMRRLVLKWQGYDGQMETSRGWYTVELLKASGMEEQLIELVIRHLAPARLYKYDRQQRERVVAELAKRGSVVTKEALYANFNASQEFRLAEEILEVDGLAGLDWVIRHSVDFLVPDNGWRFGGWVDDLKDTHGEDEVSNWIARESALRPEVAEFQRLTSMEPGSHSSPQRLRSLPESYEGMREEALQMPSKRTIMLRWAISASNIELSKAWRAFEVEQDPDFLGQLARALRRKPQFCDLD